VTFTWTPAPPAVVTAAASAVTSTTATLNGAVNPDAWQITSCEFDISPAPSGVATIPCAQQLAAGGAPIPVSATALGLAPATTYTVTLNATSVQGSSSGSPVTFTTAAGKALPKGGTSSALSVSALKLSPTRFRRGKHTATISRAKRKSKTPTATTISFTLSQAAGVKLSFELAQPGVLAGRKCGASSKTHRKGKRCIRYTAVAHDVALPGRAGTDTITFAGVLNGGVRLSPGTYRLSLSAANPTGSATATQHPTFTLLG